MPDRSEPAIPTPFVSSVMHVEPAWIDYNGHLNMAYYNVLFDRAVDEVYELLGLGLDYLKTRRHSTFTAEVHVRYLRELKEGDPVRVSFQLLDYDAKRLALFRGVASRRGGLAVGHFGEHGAERQYGRQENSPLPRRRHGAPCPHEGCSCYVAGPARRRPAHRHDHPASNENA